MFSSGNGILLFSAYMTNSGGFKGGPEGPGPPHGP